MAIFAGAVLCTTGCGGSSTEDISARALRASVAPPPPASPSREEGWQDYGGSNPQTTTLAQLRTVLVDPSEASDLKTLERTHFLRFYSSQWSRPANAHAQVIAESVANLFRDRDGALAGNDAIRSLSRSDSATPYVAGIPPLKLGERGWGFRLSGGNEAFVYGFVLRNTVIFVKMLCRPGNCAPGEHVRQAVADYASEITSRATR